jgi:hypothetical protein
MLHQNGNCEISGGKKATFSLLSLKFVACVRDKKNSVAPYLFVICQNQLAMSNDALKQILIENLTCVELVKQQKKRSKLKQNHLPGWHILEIAYQTA